MPKSITVSELLAQIPDSSALIDVRLPACYEKEAPLACRNIPYEELVLNPERYLEKGKVYYLICDNGSVSFRAAMMLELRGYKAINVRGGYYTYHAKYSKKKRK